MTLNDYELELKDAKAEHCYLAFEKKYLYEQPARALHEAHILRAHARLMKATQNYEMAKKAVLIANADTDVDELVGGGDVIASQPTLDDKIGAFFDDPETTSTTQRFRTCGEYGPEIVVHR